MTPVAFLLLNVALAFYNVGTIWAHEIDIFRTWRLIESESFPGVQRAHWRKLPYWIFLPIALALSGSIVLLWYHPSGMSEGILRAAVLCQLASLVLTVAFWGRWQAKLSRDERGPDSPYLAKILSTHWVRTALITAYAVCLIVAALETITLP